MNLGLKRVNLLICDALHALVPFVQFENREKHLWRSVNLSKVAGKPATLLKLTLLHGCFSCFLNCTNCTKSRNAPHFVAVKSLSKVIVEYNSKIHQQELGQCIDNINPFNVSAEAVFFSEIPGYLLR